MPFVGLALVLDIAFYDLFVDTNRTHEVTFRPNTVCAPIDFFEKWKLGLHVPSRVLFDKTNYLTDAPAWGNRNQQVEVILVSIDLLELDLRIMLVNGFDSSPNEGLHAVVDDLASVFSRKHNVIVAEKNKVVRSTIDGWHHVL